MKTGELPASMSIFRGPLNCTAPCAWEAVARAAPAVIEYEEIRFSKAVDRPRFFFRRPLLIVVPPIVQVQALLDEQYIPLRGGDVKQEIREVLWCWLTFSDY